MQVFNRRQWLKTAGLVTGSVSLLDNSIFRINQIEPYEKYFSDENDHTEKIIRLSSNENSYGPSSFVREKMTQGFDSACRYPGSEVAALAQKIAEKEGLSSDHILLTIGSTEGLKISALAYLQKGGELVAAEPTFEAMLNYAEACGAYVHRVPVNSDLVLDLSAMEKRCNADTKMVFLCNPNNPTGTIIPGDEMIHFCTRMAQRTLVFSDEAYFDYIETPDYPSMTQLIKKDLNVIVSRTFSKVYGLAGVRIGYLIARPDIIARIRKYQVDRPNMLALAAANGAMAESEFYHFSLTKNKEAKKMIYNTLDHFQLPYTQSHANFVFFKTGFDIKEFSKKMMAFNIAVGRPFAPLTNWCRISTGTTEEMLVLNQALDKVFS